MYLDRKRLTTLTFRPLIRRITSGLKFEGAGNFLDLNIINLTLAQCFNWF